MIDVLQFWNGIHLLTHFPHPLHTFLTINKSEFTSLGGEHIFLHQTTQHPLGGKQLTANFYRDEASQNLKEAPFL
jgi:hypothetical protein